MTKARLKRALAGDAAHHIDGGQRTPRVRIHTRSATSGGAAVGGWVVGRRRAFGPQRCQCCPCPIERGEPVFMVDRGDGGQLLLVCEFCVVGP